MKSQNQASHCSVDASNNLMFRAMSISVRGWDWLVHCGIESSSTPGSPRWQSNFYLLIWSFSCCFCFRNLHIGFHNDYIIILTVHKVIVSLHPFQDLLLFFICMSVLSAHLSMYYTHVWCLQKPGKGIRSPGTTGIVKWPQAAMTVLGTKHRSYARTEGALNY